MKFNGSDYDPLFDDARLETQLGRVYAAMRDGQYRTLFEIHSLTGAPESSISAQLRHLRKPRFGAYHVDRRPRGDRARGLFEYRLRRPTEKNGQTVLFNDVLVGES